MSLLLFVGAPVMAQDSGAATDTAAAKESARAVAQEWLKTNDEGQFDASYQAAASMMQDQVEQKVWAQKNKQKQSQLGDVKSREFAEAQYRESLPQVEGGPFVVIRYEAEYNPATFNEVVLTTQEDGEWKVASYAVQPMRPAAPPQGGNGGPGGGGK
ncbi:DUF4019 domain-containing protein [Longibacter salinarum]|nr:DUF4019 domain-containing protein [Longibacter salinarum]